MKSLAIKGLLKNRSQIFCPNKEAAIWQILASPSCTENLWGTLIAFWVTRFLFKHAPIQAWANVRNSGNF